MVKIEEIDDESALSETEGIATSDTDFVMPPVPHSDDEEDPTTGEEIDFTKSTPKNFMPEDVNFVKNLRKRLPHGGDCCNEDSTEDVSNDDDIEEERSDVVEDDGPSPQKKKKADKEEGSIKLKLITFLMLSPMVISGFFMMSEALTRFNFDKTAIQLTATVGGACIALFIMSKIPQLRAAVKFILCFSWLIFLLPTYQVYNCSPIELKNSMLGTWFKLRTGPGKFVESTYVTSNCFRGYQLQTPFKLSLISPKISLVIQINDLVNLETPDSPKSEETPTSSYFLALSKRSVKKKFHKIYLLMESSEKHTEMLSKSLKLSNSEKDKNLLVVTGTMSHLDDDVKQLKKGLEGMGYLIRPIKLKILSIEYRDKYVKLKRSADESLY